jgi:hypothetical protein
MGYVLFSPGCSLCIGAGYAECLISSDEPPPDYSILWWQEGEDGSKHDRRRDQDYLELLDLGLETNIDRADHNLSWREWEDSLESMNTGWQEPWEAFSYWGCRRHEIREELGRVHRYILYP